MAGAAWGGSLDPFQDRVGSISALQLPCMHYWGTTAVAHGTRLLQGTTILQAIVYKIHKTCCCVCFAALSADGHLIICWTNSLACLQWALAAAAKASAAAAAAHQKHISSTFEAAAHQKHRTWETFWKDCRKCHSSTSETIYKMPQQYIRNTLEGETSREAGKQITRDGVMTGRERATYL